jgi:hypothetical protein
MAISGICASSGAAAYPDFGMPDLVEMMPGTACEISVFAVGTGMVSGMNLFLEVDVPVEIIELDLRRGTIWGPPSNVLPSPIITDPQHAWADIYVLVPAAAPGKVANVTVFAPADTPIGTMAGMRTWWPEAQSSLGPSPIETGQASTVIHIIPEPAVMVLLGMGAALLRWRRRSA